MEHRSQPLLTNTTGNANHIQLFSTIKNKMVKPIVTILCAPEQNRHEQEQRAVILCTVTGEHKDNSHHTQRQREWGEKKKTKQKTPDRAATMDTH